jgi:hypothetical protein
MGGMHSNEEGLSPPALKANISTPAALVKVKKERLWSKKKNRC